MDVKEEGGIQDNKKHHEKTKVKAHIVDTQTIGPDGQVQQSRREETDIKQEQDRSFTEKVGDKIKGAGHAVSATFEDGARKIGLKE